MKKDLSLSPLLVIVICLLVMPGCQQDFDVTGIWSVNVTYSSTYNYSFLFQFPNDNNTGAVINPNTGTKGEYNLNGKNLTWTITWYDEGLVVETYSGSLDNDNQITGTIRQSWLTYQWNGSFIATRVQ